jgi:hypothetical protein
MAEGVGLPSALHRPVGLLVELRSHPENLSLKQKKGAVAPNLFLFKWRDIVNSMRTCEEARSTILQRAHMSMFID